MENLKKLKASVQLAQMRFNANGSDANRQLLEQATQAFENAQTLASPKNEQVSGEPAADVVPENTTESSDASGEKSEDQKNEELSAEIAKPSTTDNTGETEPNAESSEKKTENIQPDQA